MFKESLGKNKRRTKLLRGFAIISCFCKGKEEMKIEFKNKEELKILKVPGRISLKTRLKFARI